MTTGSQAWWLYLKMDILWKRCTGRGVCRLPQDVLHAFWPGPPDPRCGDCTRRSSGQNAQDTEDHVESSAACGRLDSLFPWFPFETEMPAVALCGRKRCDRLQVNFILTANHYRWLPPAFSRYSCRHIVEQEAMPQKNVEKWLSGTDFSPQRAQTFQQLLMSSWPIEASCPEWQSRFRLVTAAAALKNVLSSDPLCTDHPLFPLSSLYLTSAAQELQMPSNPPTMSELIPSNILLLSSVQRIIATPPRRLIQSVFSEIDRVNIKILRSCHRYCYGVSNRRSVFFFT